MLLLWATGCDPQEGQDAGQPDAAGLDASSLDADTPSDALPRSDDQVDSGLPAMDAEVDAGAAADSGPIIDAGFVQETIIDENGNAIIITNGPVGPPAEVGCADGQREGLVDDHLYPDIAACLGTWTGTVSLRNPSTQTACGDDLDVCPEAADLCAPGWHICGTSGVIGEVQRLSSPECEDAGGGRYVTAVSHCLTQSGCVYDRAPSATYPCFPSGWCSEAVCCGRACRATGVCPDGIWVGATRIAIGTDQGCGAISSRRAGGVLCCR